MNRTQLGIMAILILAAGIGIGSAGLGLSTLTARLSAPTATATLLPTATPTPGSTATPVPSPTRTVSQLLKIVGPSIVRIRTETGQGTGFVAFQGGQVLTAFHVVGSTTDRPTVITSDGTEYQAAVYGADEEKDIVLLVVPKISALPLAFARGASAGDQVIAIGYSAGLPGEPSVTRGIVSGRRVVPQTDLEYLQTDAPINPGNSGGPLLNEQGEAVGMNVWVLRGSRAQYENLGFAISAESILPSLDQLRSGAVKLLPPPTPSPRMAERPMPQPIVTAQSKPTPFVSREYTEKRADGGVYLVQQWSDGHFTVPIFVLFETVTSPLSEGEIGTALIKTAPDATCNYYYSLVFSTRLFIGTSGTHAADAEGYIKHQWTSPRSDGGFGSRNGPYLIHFDCKSGSAQVSNNATVQVR